MVPRLPNKTDSQGGLLGFSGPAARISAPFAPKVAARVRHEFDPRTSRPQRPKESKTEAKASVNQPSLIGNTGRIRSLIGNRSNTVSESTVSNTELSEFFGPHRVPGESSVSSSQPIICVLKRTHRVFCRTHRVRRRTQ